MYFCCICGKDFSSSQGLVSHLSYPKSLCKINIKTYYDKYIRKNNEGICKYCGLETSFSGLKKGYTSNICGSCNSKNIDISKNKKRSKSIKKTLNEYTLLKNNRKELICILKKQTINKNDKTQCQICGQKFTSIDKLTKHIKYHKLLLKNYYDRFFKCKNEDICLCYNEVSSCKKYTKFISLKKGYSIYCSTKCVSVSPLVQSQTKNTCLKKYNTTHPFKNSTINKKQKISINKTIKEKNNEIIEKRKKTCLDKYGVEFVSQNKEIKQKQKESFKLFKETDKYKQSRKKLYNTYLSSTFYPSMQKLLSEQNFELISEYNGAHIYHTFRCKLCGTRFKTLWNSVQQGKICQSCNDGKSKGEKDISNFLKQNNINLIENDRSVIPPLELDLFIYTNKIAIEYCGLYWHSELSNFKNPVTYHNNKLLKCNKQNIKLIQIFEDEWLFKQDIVKFRLKQILNLNNSEKIYARKCIIKEISSKIKNDFLEKFHLQGKDSSVIKLGAFYNDELVSVMTFSKGNISKGSKFKDGVWELNRFCSNYNYHVVGIASKMLKYFQRNYQWKEIFSYADRRWSDGNLYYKLGFNLQYITNPNYWYVNNQGQRIHRFNLRKRPDESKDIPEWKLRHEQGYYRIWDCGHFKFQLINENN